MTVINNSSKKRNTKEHRTGQALTPALPATKRRKADIHALHFEHDASPSDWAESRQPSNNASRLLPSPESHYPESTRNPLDVFADCLEESAATFGADIVRRVQQLRQELNELYSRVQTAYAQARYDETPRTALKEDLAISSQELRNRFWELLGIEPIVRLSNLYEVRDAIGLFIDLIPTFLYKLARKTKSAHPYAQRVVIHIQEYGQTLIKRWRKKNDEGRATVFKQVRPLMATKSNDRWKAMWTKLPLAHAFMCPAMNIEDFSKDSEALLLFLESRVSSPPSAFAHSDLESAKLRIITGTIKKNSNPCLPSYTMALDHLERADVEDTEIKFEKIYSADDLNMLRHKAVETGRTSDQDFMNHLWTTQPDLLVLEIQAGVWQFLEDWCKFMLQDIDITSIVDRAQLSSTYSYDPVHLVDDCIADDRSKAIQYATYRAPDVLDFDRLLPVVQAKISIAKDHLWDLKENPAHFAHILSVERASTTLPASVGIEVTPKTPGKGKTASKNPAHDENANWNDVLRRMVVDSHSCIAHWETISHGLDQIRYWYEKECDSTFVGHPLPDAYLATLRGFTEVLHSFQDLLIAKLRRGAPVSKLIGFNLLAPPSANGRKTSRVIPEHRATLLVDLLSDTVYKTAIGLQNIHRELESVIGELCSKAKGTRFSSWHLEIVDDLGIVAEIERELRLFKHDQVASEKTNFRRGNLTMEFEDTLCIYRAPREAAAMCYKALRKHNLAQYGAVEGSRFHHPVEKAATKAKTGALIEAEQNLDLFSNTVDEFIGAKEGIGLPQLFNIDEFKIRRTQPWVKKQCPDESTTRENAALQNTHNDANESLVLHMPATSNKPSRAFDAPLAPKKERKVKTRKSGNLEQTEEPAGLEPDLAPHLQRFIIKVHRRYYDVIPALYVIPGAAAPNEIHWRDFRDFMGHISFSYERPTGSVWRFIPDPQQCDGHRHFLIVHDTHGGNSLVMWNARDIGDRLERHYGWTSDTFVEKQ